MAPPDRERLGNASRTNVFGEWLYVPIITAGSCPVTRSERHLLRKEVRDGNSEHSMCSNDTAELSEPELTPVENLQFKIKDWEIQLKIRSTWYKVSFISDLPGVDKVMKPADSHSLSEGQLKLYKKFTGFVIANRILFRGRFKWANMVSRATEADYGARITADRPVPFSRSSLPQDMRVKRVLNFELDRAFCNLFHFTSRGTERIQDLGDVIPYFG